MDALGRPARLLSLLLLLTAASATAASDTFRLSNGRLDLAFSREHGDLVRFADTQTGQNFASPAPSSAGLWELTLAPSGVEKMVTCCTPSCCSACSRRRMLFTTTSRSGASGTRRR